MASEEVGALRALSRHLAKRGDSAEGLLARVRASGEPVTFGALYRLLASESGFKLPPSSVTLLAHTLGEEITERQLTAVLAVVDTVEGVGSGSPSDAAWARVTLALAAADLSEAAWRKPFAAARAEAADGDDVSFWSFSKSTLRPFLAKVSLNLGTAEMEQLMKSSPGKKPGTVSVRAFEHAIEARLAAGKTHANQQRLASARLGPTPEAVRSAPPPDPLSRRPAPAPSLGVRFGGVQGPTGSSANAAATPNAAPAWVTGDDDGDDDGDDGGSDGSDDDEAYFKTLALKAQSSGKSPAAASAPVMAKPALKDPYGALRATKPTLLAPPTAPVAAPPRPAVAAAAAAEAKATTTPFLQLFAAHYKQEQDGPVDDDDGEEEDSSGSEESDDSGDAQAKPTLTRKPAAAAKAAPFTPTRSSPDASLAGLLQSSFLSLGGGGSSAAGGGSSSFSAPVFSVPSSFTAVAASWTTSSFFSAHPTPAPQPPPPPERSASSSLPAGSSELRVATVAAPSFLDLFMGTPSAANAAPLPSGTAAATTAAAVLPSGATAAAAAAALALSSPLAALRSAFGSDSSPKVVGGGPVGPGASAAELRAANGGSLRGSNGGWAQRERTAKELAAEAIKLEHKEAGRAAVAAKVAAEAKARLDAAAAAQQDEVAARAFADAAAEAAREARDAAAHAASRARALALAAVAAVSQEEAAAASHVQPHAALTDAALRCIALQGGRNGAKEAPPDDDIEDDDGGGGGGRPGGGNAQMRQQLAPLLAGGAVSGATGKVGPRQQPPDSSGAMVPLGGGGRRGPNTRPLGGAGTPVEASAHRSASGYRPQDDDGKSVRSRASSRASTNLGSAVSYSTSGGTDSDAGSSRGGGRGGRGSHGHGGGGSVGWSRTETRLLMGLVDSEARRSQDALHGGFMWDAVAASLRQKLRDDPGLAARGLPQRRKAVDCRRRWDHSLKKAHATPKEQLSGEQKQWLVQYNDQRAWMASGAAGPTPDPRDASREASREAKRKASKGAGGAKGSSKLALIPEDLEVASKAEA